MSSATTTTNAGSNAGGGAGAVAVPTDQSNTTNSTPSATENLERCCETNDCNVSKLVSLVPKRKTSQFVTEPYVSEKPLLINGFTTVFQLDGTAAKLSDLKNFNGNGGGAANGQKPVYRIKPNSHVHVINYVVVDDDGDALRKINESDPETMRKLLESQKKSAEMKLKRLMFGGEGLNKANAKNVTSGAATTGAASTSHIPAATASSKANTNNRNANATTPANSGASTSGAASASTLPASAPQQPRIKVIQAASTKAKNSNSAGVGRGRSASPNTSVQLPVKSHPNLKITAISGGSDNKLPTVAGAQSSPSVTPPPTAPSPTPSTSMPLITPVPLSALQNVVLEKNNFDKMQAEIEELRRTVAMLAEAQAKSLPSPQQLPNKRSRPN